MNLRFLFFLFFALGLKAQERPNILWLTYEDTSPEFIGAYGNKAAKTPFMDFMASEGVRFTSAFSTGSVCSPSRSALITGVKTYKLGTGNHRSNYPVPDFIKGFPKYLKDAGYYTSNNAKTDYNVANQKAFIDQAWDESSNKAGWWNKKEGQAFFAVFNSNSSHQSRTMTWPYEQYKAEIWDKLPENMRTGDNDFFLPPFYRDTPAMRKQMARVYNGLSQTNIEFQALFDRLKKEDLLENTIIFSFADHGEGMPRMKTNGIGIGHRIPFTIWFPEKYKHLSPWGTGGVVTDAMIDFVDLAPTVLALAGIEIPAYMEGKSIFNKPEPDYLFLSSDRSDESYDLTRTVIKGKYAYTRVFMPFVQELRYLLYMDMGEITRLIREDFKNQKLNGQQQAMLVPRPVEYLYNLEKDPWELNNLANRSENKTLLLEFRNALKNNIIASRDVLFLPEAEIGELSKNTTAFEFRLDSLQYPIAELYKAIELCGFDDMATLKKQLKMLKSDNKLTRYWVLMGLKAHPTSQLRNHTRRITKAIKDSYAPNSILAASFLSEINNSPKAKEILQTFINSPQDHISNFAMQQILYQQNALEFNSAIKAFQEKKSDLFNANRTAIMYNYVHLGVSLPKSD